MEKKNVLSVKNLNKIYSKNKSQPINALNNLNNILQKPLTAPVGIPSLFLVNGGSA